MDYEKYIGVTEGFPKPGISFKDVSPLLADKKAFKSAIKDMAAIVKEWNPSLIIGPESRGFVFGAPIAYELGVGFAMACKRENFPARFVLRLTLWNTIRPRLNFLL